MCSYFHVASIDQAMETCYVLSSRSHGDMLYLLERSSTLTPGLPEPGVPDTVEEDSIDKILRQKDSKIHRKKDPQL